MWTAVVGWFATVPNFISPKHNSEPLPINGRNPRRRQQCCTLPKPNSANDFRGGPTWKFNTPDDINSSPALASGVLYFGCNDGFLYALDAATGAEKAKFKTGGAIWSSPWPGNGVVFVGSDDGSVYAID